MDNIQQTLVNAVKAHARANYEMDGWDYIVECYSDDDILEVIGKARTTNAAIRNAGRAAKEQDEYRKDIQSTAF